MKKISLWLATLSWAYYTFYLTTIPNFHPSADTTFSWILSNGGHFFFFGVLAVLLFLSLPKKIYTLHLSIVISSLYGLFIEFVQLNIPGRSYDLVDWGLDTLGAIIFIYILKKFKSI